MTGRLTEADLNAARLERAKNQLAKEKAEAKLLLKRYMKGEPSPSVEQRYGSLSGLRSEDQRASRQTRKDMQQAPSWARKMTADALAAQRASSQGRDWNGPKQRELAKKGISANEDLDREWEAIREYKRSGNDRTNKLVGVLAAMPADKRAVLSDYAAENAPPQQVIGGVSLTSRGDPIPAPHTTPKHQAQAPVETGPRGGKFVRSQDGAKNYLKK